MNNTPRYNLVEWHNRWPTNCLQDEITAVHPKSSPCSCTALAWNISARHADSVARQEKGASDVSCTIFGR